jgi:hypothetical protein
VCGEAAVKVTASHQVRNSYLHVRQSTVKQVLTHTKSIARHYGLRQRGRVGLARQPHHHHRHRPVHSGTSAADREGVQQLAAEVGMGGAETVLAWKCPGWPPPTRYLTR